MSQWQLIFCKAGSTALPIVETSFHLSGLFRRAFTCQFVPHPFNAAPHLTHLNPSGGWS
jgi:hypothetical protein